MSAPPPNPAMRGRHSTRDAARVLPGDREMLPDDLRAQIDDFEDWATLNGEDARNDAIRFWVLKVLASIVSVSSGIVAYFDLKLVSLVLGATASLCVVVDGVNPQGMLRNMHLRAVHDIRSLISSMFTQWRSRSSKADPDEVARTIIRDAEKQRQVIARFIRDGETALKTKI